MNREHIAISVIVPVYNTKPFLRECVQSILDQKETFPENYEVILVDDGATDGCAELCDELAAQDARIRVIHQENQGLSGARNTGIDAAVGRYYAFVDSDDILRPGYLNKLYDACEAHDAYMAICAVEDVAENGASLDPPSYTDPTATGVFVGKELLNNFYSPNGTYYTVAWNKLYRAEVWKLLHYPEGRLHEDDFIAHRLFWRCDRVVCLADHLYCYRLSSGSICRSDLKPEAFDAVDGLADRYRFFVGKRRQPHRDRLRLCGVLAAIPVPVRQGAPEPHAQADQGDLQGAVPDAGAAELPAQLQAAQDDRKAFGRALGDDAGGVAVPDKELNPPFSDTFVFSPAEREVPHGRPRKT